jgi:hypothetical protein
VEISDSLLQEARKLAARNRTTLRALVEQGLRRVLDENKRNAPFKLEHASFQGEGLQPEFANADWDQIRAASYERRGG